MFTDANQCHLRYKYWRIPTQRKKIVFSRNISSVLPVFMQYNTVLLVTNTAKMTEQILSYQRIFIAIEKQKKVGAWFACKGSFVR